MITDRLRIFSAGSLRSALTAFAAGVTPEPALTFGPAGLLRERIEAGDTPDLFLSANLAHPQTLAEARPGCVVQPFARNTLVALARRELGLTTENFLDRLLSDGVRIGTSTPLLDPSGDYAHALFNLAEHKRLGAGDQLRARGTALVGGRHDAPVPTGRYPAQGYLESGQVDVFLSYLSNARTMADMFDVVMPPASLAVGAEYGLIVLATDPDRRTAAEAVAKDLLSTRGQEILRSHGFER